MRLLVEADNNEQEISYDNLLKQTSNPSEIFKVIRKWMDDNPNKSNIEGAYDALEDSVLDTESLDEEKNPLIYYLNNIETKITNDQAALIYNVASNNDMDTTDPWLYNKSLYEGSAEDVLFKIKAMIYAANPNLQKNANQQITTPSLMDGNDIKPVDEIKKILSNIRVKKAGAFENQTVRDAREILKQSKVNDKEIDKLIKDNPIDPGETNPDYIKRLFQAIKTK